MTFQSILFKGSENFIKKETLREPDYFVDLNLNQLIDFVTTGKDEYNLKPFFYTPLNDIAAITYRHEIMQDIENITVYQKIISFADKMRTMREQRARILKLYYKHQKERWFLEVVNIYCNATEQLMHDLSSEIKSQGLLLFRDYLINYVQSDRFKLLYSKAKRILNELASVQYCIHFRDLRVQVRSLNSESNYSEEIDATFQKFKHEPVKDYRAVYPFDPMNMNHVEAQILDGVVHLYPDIFQNLESFFAENQDYLDETIALFDREIQFYIAYHDYIEPLKNTGLKFCYPQVTKESKEIYCYEGYDLALAHKLINEKLPVVVNDFHLKKEERIIVVSGPNQGGKTTCARTFGQLHYLAGIGCPVPGRKAQLFIFDKLFTHFEKEENIKNLRGKLQDDLVRIHKILNQASSDSIMVLNEIFTSTALQDQVFLSKNIMERIIELDSLCIWVTFIDELASYSKKTVSMVSTVVPDNPAMRTFKILRGPANGLAYALSIAEKYSLTYNSLKERLKL